MPEPACKPLIAMQGTQVKVDADDLFCRTPRLYNLVMLASEGTMTPDQFDQHVREIVTFLHYAAEPKGRAYPSGALCYRIPAYF